MAHSPRITLKQMAVQLGVSHTTVSLALREHPSIPRETRERIKQHAEKVGYRPDPMLASLVAYRRRKEPWHFHGTLAWLTNFPRKDEWRETSALGYFEGALRRAEKLGYTIDSFWLQEPELNVQRLRQIVNSRNIRGLLFAPQPRPHVEIQLDMEGLAGVTLGYSLTKPELHVVMNHQFRNMVNLVGHLKKIGIRKIGLALPKANDERVNHNYVAAYLAAARFTKGIVAVPYHLPASLEAEFFMKWIEKHGPEVVITERRNGERILGFFRNAGLSVPKDIQIAMVNIPYRNDFFSGIDENHEQVGATAVDVLTSMLYRNEYGLPEKPKHTLIDGVWRQGKTVQT